MTDEHLEVGFVLYPNGEIQSRLRHGELSLTTAQKMVAELECLKRAFMDIVDELQKERDNRKVMLDDSDTS